MAAPLLLLRRAGRRARPRGAAPPPRRPHQRRALHLTPREADHLQLHQAGRLAQYRLARGVKLNLPEAVALISSQCMEFIRDGEAVEDLMVLGQQLLGRNQVLDAVPSLVKDVQVEATFPDGTKLLTVHSPISAADGDLELALRGSFLPVPDLSVFRDKASTAGGVSDADPVDPDGHHAGPPGRVLVDADAAPIELNAGRALISLAVTNTGDRPVQVGSHFPFVETNPALLFDRRQAIGFRLNVPSGSSVRFEPGESKPVTLVAVAGRANIVCGNRLTDGVVAEGTDNTPDDVMARVRRGNFAHRDAATHGEGSDGGMAHTMERGRYADMFGPTVGDRVVLGDTCLSVVVERDLAAGPDGLGYGDEIKFGGGKTIREGMGQATSQFDHHPFLDTVITNALVVDARAGVVKCDVGIVGCDIVALGKAGNPDLMDGVDPRLVVGPTTEVIAGEKLILTAGAVDAHVHFICPQQIEEAVASGITTMYGGGTGPATGTNATTCTPGPAHVEMMLKATDAYPMNFGFSGKGNTSDADTLVPTLEAGAAGYKLHEDWGTTPSAIDSCLDFCDAHDVAATIHTDTLNESGFVDDSIRAIGGRTIHTYHSEGAGGGHAPDIIKVCGLPNVIPSSTNPTRPFTSNTVDEHLDMLMVCHHLDASIPEDIAFAESRIRAETIAAEDILHDMGAISIIASDSQAMGRVGEVVCRTWQTADKMRKQRGALPEDEGTGADNKRVKRYVAKYTINPAIAHGMSHRLGSVEAGKLADLVLWKPAMFGAKPEIVIKGGRIAWAQMGDPNASIPTPQPVKMRPMFGAMGGAVGDTSLAFVSQASVDAGVGDAYGLGKRVEAVKRCRDIGKRDMVENDALPDIQVDPETYEVTADGEHLVCDPAMRIPLAQTFFLF